MTLLSIPETATQLGGVHPNTVRRLIAKGKLQATKVGRRTMIDPHDLEAFIASQKTSERPQERPSNVVQLHRRPKGGSFREQARAINEARS